jgi:hypothetical protein
MNCPEHTINDTVITVERFVSAEERINPNEGKAIFIKNIPSVGEL